MFQADAHRTGAGANKCNELDDIYLCRLLAEWLAAVRLCPMHCSLQLSIFKHKTCFLISLKRGNKNSLTI